MKYAEIKNNKVVTISYAFVDGWEKVPDDVFVGFTRNGEGWEAPVPEPVSATVEDVIAERDRRIDEGTTINVHGIGDIPVSGSVAVQIDMMAQSQRASILQAEGDTETKILFKDREDVVHQLSADQFQQLFKAGVEWVESVKAKAWALIKMNPTPSDFHDNKYW